MMLGRGICTLVASEPAFSRAAVAEALGQPARSAQRRPIEGARQREGRVRVDSRPLRVGEDGEPGDEVGRQLWVPGVAPIEMVSLVERGRMAWEPVERLLGLLATADGSYAVAPLDQGTARALRTVPRSAVPDMPDRIIVATAQRLGAPLIARSEAIVRAAVVPVVW